MALAEAKAKIESLQAEVDKLEASGKAANTERGKVNDLYKEANTAYESTITAIGDAIAALEGAQTNTDSLLLAQQRVQQALALSGSSTTEKEKDVLEDFLYNTTRPELKASGDFDTHTKKYAFKSSSVIELLKGLKEKFENEKLETTKAETASLNAYDLAKQARDELITKAGEAKDTKDAELIDTNADLDKAKEDKKTEEDNLKADSDSLMQTQKVCALKKTEYAERTETRTQEMEAMKAAVKILAESTGVRIDVPENPVPPPSPVAFLQMAVDPRQKAVQLLRAEARLVHSKGLDRLAQEISAHLSGPFGELDNMISCPYAVQAGNQRLNFRINIINIIKYN